MKTTTPAKARVAVLRELAKGPRTLSELTKWALPRDFKRLAEAAPVVDGLLDDGLVVLDFELSGTRRRLQTVYRLAPRADPGRR